MCCGGVGQGRVAAVVVNPDVAVPVAMEQAAVLQRYARLFGKLLFVFVTGTCAALAWLRLADRCALPLPLCEDVSGAGHCAGQHTRWPETSVLFSVLFRVRLRFTLLLQSNCRLGRIRSLNNVHWADVGHRGSTPIKASQRVATDFQSRCAGAVTYTVYHCVRPPFASVSAGGSRGGRLSLLPWGPAGRNILSPSHHDLYHQSDYSNLRHRT